jgi:DNA-directed RNA polymerase specialized sigma24 family protein
MVTNAQDADDLAQDAVMRMLRGDFANATPERGRFRHLLKTALRNMVRNHWSRDRKRSSLKQDLADVAEDTSFEQEWSATWRKAILDHAWNALKEQERARTGTTAFTLLKLRAEFPDDDSAQLAQRLSEAVGRSIRPDAMRQQLRRARLLFAQLLIEEIAHGMDAPTPERMEEELTEVGLMEYVREFLPADWRTRGELAADAE